MVAKFPCAAAAQSPVVGGEQQELASNLSMWQQQTGGYLRVLRMLDRDPPHKPATTSHTLAAVVDKEREELPSTLVRAIRGDSHCKAARGAPAQNRVQQRWVWCADASGARPGRCVYSRLNRVPAHNPSVSQ